MSDDARNQRDDAQNTLGQRIQKYRKMRGLSVRTCADLAGFSASYLSRVESGTRALDRRSYIESLAEALQISTAELLGEPYQPREGAHSTAHAQVQAIRRALMSNELGETPDIEPWRPLAELDRMVTESRIRLYRHGDVAGAAVNQADALDELHAHVAANTGADRDQALRLLVVAASTASSTTKWMGYGELSWIAALRSRQAARALADPGMIGFAEMRVAMSTRPYSMALGVGTRAIEQLDPEVGDDPERMQILGMLHLMMALDCAVLEREDDAAAHLDAAAELSERTGEANAFELYFGPTNTKVWSLSIAVEQGAGGRARDLARTLPAGKITGRCRRATYYQDLGRALAQDGRPREAGWSLLEAERLNPVEIRNNALARNLVMTLLPQLPRSAGGVEIRALAHRMGVV